MLFCQEEKHVMKILSRAANAKAVNLTLVPLSVWRWATRVAHTDGRPM